MKIRMFVRAALAMDVDGVLTMDGEKYWAISAA